MAAILGASWCLTEHETVLGEYGLISRMIKLMVQCVVSDSYKVAQFYLSRWSRLILDIAMDADAHGQSVKVMCSSVLDSLVGKVQLVHSAKFKDFEKRAHIYMK